MPDAPGLELIAQKLNGQFEGAVRSTSFDHEYPTLIVDPKHILGILGWLRNDPSQQYRFLASVHASDYLPAQPRFGVHYDLLNMPRVERLHVRAALRDPATDPTAPGHEAEEAGGVVLPEMDSCVELFPTADFQEREVYDFFGIVFRGHPDLRRILMPDDYVGWPQRRDFPVGGEPVIFSNTEKEYPGWYQ